MTKSLFIFTLTFSILTWAGRYANEYYNLKLLGRAQEQLPSNAPENSWIGAYLPCSQDALDYYYFYYNIGDSITNARRAEVLLMGSSRIQYAFSVENLVDFEKRTHMTLFNLGFGYSEGLPFALELMRRYELFPKLIIVNGDGFFNRIPSYIVSQVKAKGKLKAEEQLLECNLSFRFSKYVEQVFPSFVSGRHDNYILRNTIYGSWFAANWSQDRRQPLRNVTPTQFSIDNALVVAREFKTEIEKRGARLILTWIPTNLPVNSRGQVEQLANLIQVPFISPQLPGLTSIDGSHLSHESALEFSKAFFQELEQKNPPGF